MKVLKDLVVTGNASAANLSGNNTGDQDLSNLVVKNSPITGATKIKITYDAKGLVTAGADATTADIAASTNKNYVTDADLVSLANLQTALNAKVAGPASATNTAIALFDTTTGKLLKNSTVTIDTYGIMRFASSSAILVNTSRGSDNASLGISSSGSGDSLRGAYIMMLGNQYTGAEGDLQLYAGDSGIIGKGAVRMMAGGAERFVLNSTGAIKFNNAYTFPTTNGTGVLTNDGAGNLTWASASGMTNPMTTLGDIIYGGTSGVATRLAGNTNNSAYFLRSTASGGVATAPAWQASIGTGNIVLATTPTIITPIIDSISSSANSINAVLWSEPTTGNITIGSGQTSGVLTIGGTTQTGNFNLATGTGALAINIGTGGTGVKTISIGTAAIANIISIGNLGNSRIGNVTTPLSELQISTERTAVPRGILSTQHSSGTGGSRVMFRKSRGTYASPTVITTGDNLGRFTAGGYDGASYVDDMAVIEFQSTGTIGTTRIPTQIIFSTATDASPSVLTNAVVIKANQVMDYSADVSANFVDLSIVNKKYVVDNFQAKATNLTSLAGLNYVSASFVKMTAAGTFSLDTNTYLTGNQSITLSGAVSGSGTTSISTTLGTNIVGASNMKGASSTQLTNGTSGNLLKSLGDGTFGWDTTAYTPSSRTLTINGTAYDLSTDRSWTISAGSSEVTVAQTGHGFSVGNAIYSTGNNTYAKCLANAVATSEFVGIVTTVTDANNFKFSPPGTVITAGVPAVVGGTVMYLDPVTAGALTSTEPSTSGYVSKPVMIVLNNAASAEVVNMRGVLIGSGANAVATVQTWPIALNNNLNIYMGSGSNTTWYAYGTLFTPDETMTVTTNSSMKWIMTSTSSGYFIMAVYKYVNGGAQTLMFKSNATALGGSATHLTARIASITDGTLVAGTWYYMVIIQNQNGTSSAGVSLGGSSTIKPYRNFTQSLGNLGADGAGSAPSTITEPSGETTNGVPWILLKL